mgnify:CR=1 FL=1
MFYDAKSIVLHHKTLCFYVQNKSFSYQETAYYNCFTSVSIAHNPTFSHSSL